MIPTGVRWLHPFADIFVDMLPQQVGSVVDVGCGRGIAGALIGIYREPRLLIGVDGFQPSLDFCSRLYTETIKHDLNESLPFKDGEFDLAVCLETIEHLEKTKSLALLRELKRISSRVIISTPNTFSQQPAYDGNELQHHRSIYSIRELRELGFRVSFFRAGKVRMIFNGRYLPGLASRLWNGFFLAEWRRTN